MNGNTDDTTRHARELAAAAEATIVKADDNPSERGKTLVCIRVDRSKLSFIGLNQAMDTILDLARANRASAVPPGWQLVPIQPTRDMSVAGQPHLTAAAAYVAMLEAAPTPPRSPAKDRAATIPSEEAVAKAILKECVEAEESISDGAAMFAARAVLALCSPVTLSPPTPDQEAYLRNIQKQTEAGYDPDVVVGGPNQRELDKAGITPALREKLEAAGFEITTHPSRAFSAAPTESDMRAFGASEAACYKWPDDTPEHRALRAAYCEGAADCGGSSPDSDGGGK